MSGNVEFHILFDGEATGLAAHRLSLVSFHRPLGFLLAAFRRTADQVASASQARQEGRHRFGVYGQKLDLQLYGVADGCVQLAFKCVVATQDEVEESVTEGIIRETVARVITKIEREAKGQS